MLEYKCMIEPARRIRAELQVARPQPERMRECARVPWAEAGKHAGGEAMPRADVFTPTRAIFIVLTKVEYSRVFALQASCQYEFLAQRLGSGDLRTDGRGSWLSGIAQLEAIDIHAVTSV